jgi:hypothetical protein
MREGIRAVPMVLLLQGSAGAPTEPDEAQG